MNKVILLFYIFVTVGVLSSIEGWELLDRANRDYISGDYAQAFYEINSYYEFEKLDTVSNKSQVLGEQIYYFYIQTEITSEDLTEINMINTKIEQFPQLGSSRVKKLLQGIKRVDRKETVSSVDNIDGISHGVIDFNNSVDYSDEEMTLLLKTTLLEGKRNSKTLERVLLLLLVFTVFSFLILIGILLSYLYVRRRVKIGKAKVFSPVIIGNGSNSLNEINDLIKECLLYSKKIDIVTGRKNNSQNIADIVYKISKEAEISDNEALLHYCASLIYDIGLLSVDEKILKSESVTEAEYLIIQNHVKVGLQLVPFIPEKYKRLFYDAISKHHENIDGSGYPNNLKGTDIPMLPRIIRVVESYVSLISKREYRIICDKEAALLHLRREVDKYDQYYVDLLDLVM